MRKSNELWNAVSRKSGHLGLWEHRQIDRIVGQCGELWADPVAWQTHALERLVELAHARVGLAFDVRVLAGDGSIESELPIGIGWLDASERATFFRHYAASDGLPANSVSWTAFARLFQTRPSLTRARQYLVDCRAEDNSAWYSAYVRPTSLRDVAYSAMRIPRTRSISLWLVSTDKSQAPLDVRAQRLTHFVHSRLSAMIGTRLATAAHVNVSSLTKRQRDILALLLDGLDESAIAHVLSRSRATVHEHVLAIYRHFSVTTRAQLMAHFLRRQPLAHDGSVRRS